MKRGLVILVLLCGLFVTGQLLGKTITLTNGEWPPYCSKGLTNDGLASDIVKRAFAEVGIDVKYKFMPWKRAFKQAKEDTYPGSILWGVAKKREKDFYYSDKVIELSDVFFYRKDNPIEWKSYVDLKGKKIGTSRGHYYGDKFAKAAKDGVFKEVVAKDDFLNFKKLIKKKIDAFVCTFEVGHYILNTRFPPTQAALIGNTSTKVRTVGYYLILNKKNKDNKALLGKFNEGLKKLKAKGVLKQLQDDLVEGKYTKK